MKVKRTYIKPKSEELPCFLDCILCASKERTGGGVEIEDEEEEKPINPGDNPGTGGPI